MADRRSARGVTHRPLASYDPEAPPAVPDPSLEDSAPDPPASPLPPSRPPRPTLGPSSVTAIEERRAQWLRQREREIARRAAGTEAGSSE